MFTRTIFLAGGGIEDVSVQVIEDHVWHLAGDLLNLEHHMQRSLQAVFISALTGTLEPREVVGFFVSSVWYGDDQGQ
jgi:hypothetical protein